MEPGGELISPASPSFLEVQIEQNSSTWFGIGECIQLSADGASF